MTRESDSKREAAPKAGGSRVIPPKPRDCGPHVDTWPILDDQADDAPKPKADAYKISRKP